MQQLYCVVLVLWARVCLIGAKQVGGRSDSTISAGLRQLFVQHSQTESHADNCQQIEGRIKFYECVGEDMVVAGLYLRLSRAIWAVEAVPGLEYTCSLLSVYTPDCCMGDK